MKRTANLGRTALALCAFTLFSVMLLISAGQGFAAAPGAREHLVFWKGTAQELEVFKIYGRRKGPTIMIMGGVQGDEPGGFLSAELYAQLTLKRGNLIVVPRANMYSVMRNNRGPGGDMNRKFEQDAPGDPESRIVEVLKSLMAESDVFLNLHDGSGFYRPTWESDMANPKRYGQCIIADTASYRHEASGREIELATIAKSVIEHVNREIDNPLHKFHFFNMETVREDTKYMEQRKSASYYALTQIGIPAFAIETSKQLPSLEMKIYQHNIAINAFLRLYGIEVDSPGFSVDKAVLGYVLVAVNNAPPIAVAPGQTLKLSPGDSLEVVDVSSNYENGISVEIQGKGWNYIRKPVHVTTPTTIIVRKDSTVIGRITVALFSSEAKSSSPQLLGSVRPRPPRLPVEATLEMLPGARIVAEARQNARDLPLARAAKAAGDAKADQAAPAPSPETPKPDAGLIRAFLVEVDGQPMEILPGEELATPAGARVKLVDFSLREGGSLPEGVVMNLKGFVPAKNKVHNNGEDRGEVADTSRDLQPAFSQNRKGEVYAINAELGKEVLASCSLRLTQPKRAAVTLRYDGVTHTLPFGSRISIPPGTRVEVLDVSLKGGARPLKPRYTLAGHPLPTTLPQTLTMRSIAINLAVFEDDTLVGKVTWLPK